jgi:ribonucleoside-diphosphate reductase alpha chain
MKVEKRNGTFEPLSFDKITYRLKKLCNDKALGKLTIDPDVIAQKVISGIYDGVTSRELDEEAARIAVGMSENLQYSTLAARIIISNLHKSTSECFSEVMEQLYNNKDISGNDAPILADDFIDIVRNNKDTLNFAIDYSRDYLFDYFGFKTLEKSYLIKQKDHKTGIVKVVERPQHLYMRVAVGIHKKDIESVIKTYNLISQHYYTHASPTLFNAGTRLANLSSCFLMYTDDSIEGIFKTITDCGKISKLGGGIGVHVSNIRSKGSTIRGTNGVSDGIVPMLKLYNSTATYVNQCFTPDTWVYSKSGPKQMENISTEDELVTIDGSYKKVNEVVINKVKKELLEVRVTHSFLPVSVTKEHELYLIKGQKKETGYPLIKQRLESGIIQPDFYQAQHLTEDDLVGFPIPSYVNDATEFDCDFFKFYGLMLGDGYHHTDNYFEYGICLDDIKKVDEQTFIKAFLASRNLKYWTIQQKGCTKIGWYDSGNESIGLTREMLYDKHGNKVICSNFLHLPHQKTLKLVEGLLKSDGNNLKELHFTNTSLQLVMQLRFLLLRLGIMTSGCINNNIDKSHTTKKVAYRLRIPKHPILSSIIVFQSKGQHLKYFEWNGMLWGRIKTITPKMYEGDVYDFNMIDNHNYLTDMGLVHNSGRRKGSFAMYLEPWHADVMEFLDLKKNQGHDDVRARDLFYALWTPDLFMKQVEEDGDWYLMCPDECPGLTDAYGDKFEELYWKYVKMGKYRQKVKAQEVWKKVLEAQNETGVPYIGYKDAVNKKCNQKNLGTIKSSNLCIEISIFSDNDEYGVCNLCSLALPKFVKHTKDGKAYFDFDHLREVAEYVVRPMNCVIDVNYYPTPQTEKSNIKHRPIGIGAQGLADVYFKMGLPFESSEAKKLNKEIFETIYFGAVQGSIELAKECGAYETFAGSPFSEGHLQFDLAAKFDGIHLNDYLSGRWDWDSLKKELTQYGTRNSLLLALMPTASSAQIMGNTESFEPIDSCIFKRRVLSGEYMIINKYLVADLQKLNLWSKEMKDIIIANEGSIQNIEQIPQNLKAIYKTVWEISMKSVIEQCHDRGVFVDQMQSMNLFMANPTFKKLTSMHFHAWKSHLKSGMYYLRSKSSASAGKFTLDAALEKKMRDKKDAGKKLSKSEETLLCSIDNKDDCMMCSS